MYDNDLGRGGEGKSFTFDNIPAGPIGVKVEPSVRVVKAKPVFSDFDPDFIFVIDDN